MKFFLVILVMLTSTLSFAAIETQFSSRTHKAVGTVKKVDIVNLGGGNRVVVVTINESKELSGDIILDAVSFSKEDLTIGLALLGSVGKTIQADENGNITILENK